ncbi:MAG TPA: hypothetical protein VIL83_05520 [Capillibacterium sp.]
MAQEEENFKKEVIIKEDGRYLIYYDFSPASPVDQGKKEPKSEEGK